MDENKVIVFSVKHVKLDEPGTKEPDWESLGLLPAKKDDKEYYWKYKSFYVRDISNVTVHDEKESIISTYLAENFFVEGNFKQVFDRLYKKEKNKNNSKKKKK